MSDDVLEVPGHQPRQRVSRFDRPKEPHDWRWVLGIVGRTLISIGVLLFAFVAYQLWGTGIQTAREQNRLRSEFENMLESTVPLTSGAPVTTVDPPSSDPPASTIDPISTAPAAVVEPPPVGDPVARLAIPVMDIENKIVVEGVSPDALQDGPGHFPETPLPGQLGNAAIAGHRTTHGEPFRHIDRLEVGDEIIVTTVGGRFIYLVTGSIIVEPSDYELVIPTIDPSAATLTLTSCHPPLSAQQRIVVFSALDVERSSPVTLPSGELGDRTVEALPGDDVAEPNPPDTVPVGAAPADTTGSSGSSEPGTTDPVVETVAGPPSESEEVFQNQWFSDPTAFPQVALWGFVLIGLSLGAHAISRRARRNWVGALVGIAPFLVALYFFFENVNRLLPPNL